MSAQGTGSTAHAFQAELSEHCIVQNERHGGQASRPAAAGTLQWARGVRPKSKISSREGIYGAAAVAIGGSSTNDGKGCLEASVMGVCVLQTSTAQAHGRAAYPIHDTNMARASATRDEVCMAISCDLDFP